MGKCADDKYMIPYPCFAQKSGHNIAKKII